MTIIIQIQCDKFRKYFKEWIWYFEKINENVSKIIIFLNTKRWCEDIDDVIYE